jgi:hypothetical protein
VPPQRPGNTNREALRRAAGDRLWQLLLRPLDPPEPSAAQPPETPPGKEVRDGTPSN